MLLAMVAGCGEKGRGIQNLWKKGVAAGGRKEQADLGRYVDMHMFKCFCSAWVRVYAPEKWWYVKEVPWDVFKTALTRWNLCRTAFGPLLIGVLDESMSGWR